MDPYTVCTRCGLFSNVIFALRHTPEEINTACHCDCGWDEPLGYVCEYCGHWVASLAESSPNCNHNRVVTFENASVRQIAYALAVTFRTVKDRERAFERLMPIREAIRAPLPPYITCPVCHKTSFNWHDIEQGYCGKCHDWTTPLL